MISSCIRRHTWRAQHVLQLKVSDSKLEKLAHTLSVQTKEVGRLLPPPPSIPAPPEFTIFPCSKREKERRKPYYQLVASTGFFSPFPI